MSENTSQENGSDKKRCIIFNIGNLYIYIIFFCNCFIGNNTERLLCKKVPVPSTVG